MVKNESGRIKIIINKYPKMKKERDLIAKPLVNLDFAGFLIKINNNTPIQKESKILQPVRIEI